ncbi:MAG: hypothetical protein ABEI75_04340 [Halobaculum sp.]
MAAAHGENCEVMAAVDATRLVIADVCRDDAWISVPERDAPVLADWC